MCNAVSYCCLQVGQRCSVGWSSRGPLFGGVCHRIRLPLRVLKQVPAGALPPGDWQRIPADVREVLCPRLGVPVPAQPPAHQLCGPADRKPGLHEPRLVASMFSSIYVQSWLKSWSSQYLAKAFFNPKRNIPGPPMSSTIAELWIKSVVRQLTVIWLKFSFLREKDKRFCLGNHWSADLPVHHFTDAPNLFLNMSSMSMWQPRSRNGWQKKNYKTHHLPQNSKLSSVQTTSMDYR